MNMHTFFHIPIHVLSLFTLFYVSRRKYWFSTNFRLRFLMDLHALGCPEHDLIIFGTCLSVCLSVCVTRELMNRIS